MKAMLKNARITKGIQTRELARQTKIDPALISKFESGGRFPTLKQLEVLSSVLEISFDELKQAWIKARILDEYGKDENTLAALKAIISNEHGNPTEDNLDYIFEEIEKLKQKLKKPN